MIKSIAVDGPAGAGKSTIARMAAKRIGYIYVDTGAMFRTIALSVIRQGTDINSIADVKDAIEDINVSLDYLDDTQIVLLNGENVNDLIRTPQVSSVTSSIARYSCVRDKLLGLQRGLAVKKHVIMDGRDIGTTVIPEAFIKIYLTASVEARAERRYRELVEKGEKVDLKSIEEDISERDRQDMTREISPLKKADDAIFMDTSLMTVDEVVQNFVNIYELTQY